MPSTIFDSDASLAAAAQATAEEVPVPIPILATGVKALVDLIRNDAPALVGDIRTIAADLKAPEAVQAVLANDELANLLAQGAIWLDRRVAAVVLAKQPATTDLTKLNITTESR